MQGIHQPTFGSSTQQEILDRQIRAARRSQTVPIAIAPLCSVEVVRDGKALVLQAGAELQPTDFVAGSTVRTVLHQLLDHRVVIVLTSEELEALRTPADAEFVVARDLAISCNHPNRRRIATEGTQVTADDFENGQVGLDDLVARGAVVRRVSRPQPAPATIGKASKGSSEPEPPKAA